MLKPRILSTLRFFDLQELPLTLLELHAYLLNDAEKIKTVSDNPSAAQEKISLQQLAECVDKECAVEIETDKGFYCLQGKTGIIKKRLDNYMYAITRERLIRRYAKGLGFVPFVRGAALAGSQALGFHKPTSDIDLLIITDTEFLWLTRTLVTAYFQILGKRRYGRNITNRFCLNHYIAAPKEVQEYKNIYTASEYLKLRPLVFPEVIYRFQYNNKGWIGQLFPNAEFIKQPADKQPLPQKILEKLFSNSFGYWLEKKLKAWQLPKIRIQEKFIVVKDDELSFHPQSKQQALLDTFFKT